MVIGTIVDFLLINIIYEVLKKLEMTFEEIFLKCNYLFKKHTSSKMANVTFVALMVKKTLLVKPSPLKAFIRVDKKFL